MPLESKDCPGVFDARELREGNEYSRNCDEQRTEIVYIFAVNQHKAGHDK